MYLGMLNGMNCVFHISAAYAMSFFNYFLIVQMKLSNQTSQFSAEGKQVNNDNKKNL